MARVMDGDHSCGDDDGAADDELRRVLAYLYRNPDALEGPARAMVLAARQAAGPDLDEPGGEPDEDDVERKAADPDDVDNDGSNEPDGDEDDGPSVAGVVLLAADTGRVLMLQRALDDPDDPARGTWEFPGGHVEPGDPDPLEGGKREWSEEIGHPVPPTAEPMHEWTSPNGVYRGHVLVIPHEDDLDLSVQRTIANPDDDSEQVAWWKIPHAMRNPALRRECQRTPWNALKRTVTAARRKMNVEEKAVQVDDAEVKRAGDRDDDGIPDANDPTPRGSAAGPGKADQGGGKGKRHVASEAGSRRYHLPIGAEIGKARNPDAQKAQEDPKARAAYEKLLTANPREYRKMLDDMGDAELQALSRVAYSFKSSNPQVVQARIALAGALRRRGQDVNDYGGLGKSTGGGKPAPAKTSRARGSATSTATGRKRQTTPKDPTWVGNEDWQARRTRRTKLGLTGRGVPPTAKQKRGEGGAMMTLHVYEDGSWQYKGADPDAETIETADGPYVFVEAKRVFSASERRAAHTIPGTDSFPIESEQDLRNAIRAVGRASDPAKARQHIITQARRLGHPELIPDDWKAAHVDVETTDPWERALVAAEAKRADKGGTEGGTIKTIGDLASAIKRAKSIKDEEARDAARAKIRTAAAKLKATNMIPKDWGKADGDDDEDDKGGKGKGKWTPPWEKSLPDDLDTLDPVELAALIEAKVMSPDPRAAKLREYWAHGPGTKKWRPGTPGDFDRLRRHLRKYVPPHMLNGLTANIHKLATGTWPGKNAHRGKGLDVELDIEEKGVALDAGMLAEAEALDPADTDDDAVTLALDRYADMEDELTSEEEYEAAIAREVDWELMADGSLERADGQAGHAVLDGDKLGDDDEDDEPSSDPDDALAGLEEILAS